MISQNIKKIMLVETTFIAIMEIKKYIKTLLNDILDNDHQDDDDDDDDDDDLHSINNVLIKEDYSFFKRYDIV